MMDSPWVSSDLLEALRFSSSAHVRLAIWIKIYPTLPPLTKGRKTIRPKAMADNAMHTSVPGSGSRMRPDAPPKAMTSGKVIGKIHTAGAPS